MIARTLVLVLVVAASASPLVGQPLRRVIAPFTVERTNGEAYANPFSGGLWQPRIGLRDVDGDGRIDLFTLNPDGELRLHRNEGAFVFRRIIPSAYDTLPINNWFRFVDLDGDGDAEILTAGPRSEVMVLDNEGTDAAPAFRVPARMLLNDRGDTIRTQRETVPSLVDIDSDGDVDLFAGNLDGSITFYRNAGTAAEPAFAFETDEYEDILVIADTTGAAREPGADGELHASSRHGASVLDFTDLDGDGDLDILFGDFFTRKLLHFRNFGTPQAADFSMAQIDTAFRPTGDDVVSEGFNQPVTGDLDGDGDLDAIIASLYPTSDAQPLVLYENTGSSTSPQMRRRSIDLTSEVDLGTFATPALIEDSIRRGLLVGSSAGRLTYFERIDGPGGGYRSAATIALPGLYQTVPAAGDLDGDGIAEVVIGESNGSINFHRFEGNTLVRYGETLLLNRNASPTLVDLDGDGDLDIFAGAENGRFAYFENTGSTTSATFELSTPPAPFNMLDLGYDSSPRFFDLDGDGVLEIIVGSRTGGSGRTRDTLWTIERDGAGYVVSTRYPPITVARNPVPLGLRRPEGMYLLVGDLAGGIRAFFDSSQASAIRDESRATGIRIAPLGNHVLVEWPERSHASSIRVVDMLGRTFLARSIDAAERSTRLDLSGLPTGLHCVEAIMDDRREVMIVPIVK